MSGICGIVNLDGAPVAPELLNKMAQAAAHRGPDGIRYRMDGNVGLAHLALNTTPESLLECQPMCNRDGTCWITADARVDNRDGLIRTLVSRGVHLEHPSDAELILAAYDTWGSECPKNIVGDFAFAIWDGRRHRLFCARDHLGVRPFYYRFDENSFTWASEIKQILQHPEIRQELNESMVGHYLAGNFGVPVEETFYQGIYQVLPAYSLTVQPGGMRKQRYWDADPGKSIRYRDDSEYAEHFSQVFGEAVRCRLRSSQPVGALMSGGLDSCSVVCLAAELYRQDAVEDSGLEIFSSIFEELSSCDEREYIEEVVKKYEIPISYLCGDEIWPFRDYSLVNPPQDEPFQGPYKLLFEAALDWARRGSRHVLLTGHGGDTVVAGNAYYYAELLRSLKLRRLISELKQHSQIRKRAPLWLFLNYALRPLIPQQAKPLLKTVLGRGRSELPAWIEPRFARKVQLHERLRNSRAPRRFSSFSQQRTYEQITSGWNPYWFTWLDYLSSRFGVEQRHPFFDLRLVEFALALPPEQSFQGGRTKALLRRAMDGVLPDEVRQRTGKTYWSALFDRGLKNLDGQLAFSELRARGYIDRNRLEQELQRILRDQSGDRDGLWRALTLEIWMKAFFGAQAVETSCIL